jgi:hypothetical protein
MRSRFNTVEFKSILQKMPPCSFEAAFPYVQSKYRMLGLEFIRQFQKGCH